MFKNEPKTAISQAAIATAITSGVLGVLPFFNVDVSVQQATNLGLFGGAVIGFAIRQIYKRKKSK